MYKKISKFFETFCSNKYFKIISVYVPVWFYEELTDFRFFKYLFFRFLQYQLLFKNGDRYK